MAMGRPEQGRTDGDSSAKGRKGSMPWTRSPAGSTNLAHTDAGQSCQRPPERSITCCSPVFSIYQLGLAITCAAGVDVSTCAAFSVSVERSTLQAKRMLTAGVSCSRPPGHSSMHAQHHRSWPHDRKEY